MMKPSASFYPSHLYCLSTYPPLNSSPPISAAYFISFFLPYLVYLLDNKPTSFHLCCSVYVYEQPPRKKAQKQSSKKIA